MASTELSDLGEETDEYTESTSKLRDLIMGMTGFDILESDGQTFKDIYEIILGIGREWQNLTDLEQASLGEALAGKRNANALYAVLGNLDTLVESYETAEQSAGSALQEQERYEQSVQYSIDRMNASLESLAESFLKSDFLKGLIDFGNGAINIFEKLIDTIGVIPTLGLGGSLFARAKNVGEGKCNPSCFEIANNNTCSFGHESFRIIGSEIHYCK